MGKGSKPTIGFWYHLAYHHGLTVGPIDAFLEFRGGDKTAWSGELTSSGTIHVNAPMLWGGEKDQGGIVGDLDVMFGEPTQAPNPYLVQTFGPQTAAWRGFSTVAFKGGRYGAMNPYPKPPSYKFRQILDHWDEPGCWYPEKAVIAMPVEFTPPAPQQGYWRVEAGAQYTLLDQSVVFGTVTDSYIATADDIGRNAIAARNASTGSAYEFSGSQYTTELDSVPGIVAWDAAHGSNVGIAAVKATPVCPSGYDWSVAEGADTTPELDAPVVMCTLRAPTLLAINPAHVLYYSRTNREMGRESRDSINDASLRAAADKLYDEGFGICPDWDPANESVEDFEKRICKLIGASFTRSLEDSQWYLDLARGDYVLADLPILTDDDILDFKEQPSILDNAVNSVSVRYFDPERKETVVTAPTRALGLVAAFGTIHQTTDYRPIPTGGLASRVAQRDVLASATPNRVFDLATMRKTYAWRPNQYFRLQAPKRGIADMVCIVGDKQSGTLKSGAIRMKAAQDIYSLPSTGYVQVEPGVDTRPPQTPTAITAQRVLEAPYVEIAAMLSRADLAALPAEVGYAMAVAADPGSDLDYTMMVADASGIYADAGRGQWCATATLVEAAGYLDTDFTVVGGARLDAVTVGMGVLWDDEIARVDALDVVAGTITLGRGCADTVPQPHAAGARVWIYPAGFVYSTTEFTDAETVNVKLLANTGSQQQLIETVAASPITFDHRQARPYPPSGLTLNGMAYSTSVVGPDVEIAFVPRDRVLQADQLVDTTMPGVGPEAGTTYTLRGYLGGALVHTEAAATASPFTWTPGAGGSARVEVDAVRDGLASWQPLAADFMFSEGGTLTITGTFPGGTVGTAYDEFVTIAGGENPYTLTGGTGIASGSLPAGLSLSVENVDELHLSGMPTTAEAPSFTASVDSADGQTATSAQSVTISAASAGYNALVASYAPDNWWRLDQTSGTAATDSGSQPFDGTLTGGSTFASSGVSVPAPTGYAGLGRGVDFAAAGVDDVRFVSGGADRPAFAQPPLSYGSWTIVLVVAGSAGASQYLASRVNSAAIIYNFVADTVEFFALGYSGDDLRPGSQIPLDSSDATTPHKIVYRYDGATNSFTGWKDGTQVFAVTRHTAVQGSFSLFIGSDSTANRSNCKTWDFQGYNRALTDSEIADMWAARNNA